MRPKKLIWQLYLSYLLIMGLPIIIVTWYAARSFSTFYMNQIASELTIRATLIGSQIEEHCGHNASSHDLDSLCKLLGKKTTTRYTVIAPSGKVLGDSEKNPDSMENHSNRSEIIAALAGKTGTSDRFSYTLHETMMYTAVPIYVGDSLVAVVRTALPVTAIKSTVSQLISGMILGIILLALFAALISFIISRKVSRPIESMKIGAQRFAAGDFNTKLQLSGNDETDKLAIALNEMANRLSTTITTITEQHTEVDAILSSMVEGVIAVDSQEKIITLNKAAATLFGIHQDQAPGKWIGEAVRNVEIREFLLKTLNADGYTEGEAVIFPAAAVGQSESERFLQLHGSVLRTSSGNCIGALVVINDISHIKKLENLRKDFVANVSHELRTPLTSIKGFAETLLAGSINAPDEAQRFLTIIVTQVDRLNTIVEDLLALSRIERETELAIVELKPGTVVDVLNGAIQTCTAKAQKKNIVLNLECDNNLTALMDRPLLEQAVVNLIDNAINYSEENKPVYINAVRDAQTHEIVMSVKDEGSGIAREHHDRLFERFYRVDKARSRKLGGTGLGLSIVKHIVLAHNGRVTVTSAPGSGSTFYIIIPDTAAKTDV
jgi:two-component system phosphate regulon sensor histidine kinase PhoR